MLFFLLLQSVAAAAPDIEIGITARARSVEIERKGQASLRVTASPDGGSVVEAEALPPAGGRTSLRNVRVQVHGEARIAAPDALAAPGPVAAPEQKSERRETGEPR